MTTEKKEAPQPKTVYKPSEGHAIVEVLKPYPGMSGPLVKGDIIEVPMRHVKDSNRLIREGFHKLYTKGDKKPKHR
jgi:hypothetical protein